MSTTYDLAVVGAGPAGSNAAAGALDGGLSVVQLEKARFPRTKPCAGGLTVRAARSLLLELEPSLRRTFAGFAFNAWRERETTYRFRGPLLRMVLRPDFDAALVRQNGKRDGFVFHDDEGVRDIRWDGRCFTLETERRTVQARQLVGADGAYGIVRRRFPGSEPRGRATAVEIVLPRSELVRPATGALDVPTFDFGFVPQGYGWVFPKDDHLSVGLYTLQRGVKGLRRELARYVEAVGLVPRGDPLASFEAHLIPVGGFRPHVPAAPVYLTGDAAALADALTGEGIRHALESGRLAAEVAVARARGEAQHADYYERLRRGVGRDTWLSYRLAPFFYRDVEFSLRWLERAGLWRPLVHGYGNGATLFDAVVRAPAYWLRSRRGKTAQRGAPASRST